MTTVHATEKPRFGGPIATVIRFRPRNSDEQQTSTVDTTDEYVRYVFRTCWHGLGEPVRQCRVQSVDVFP